MHHFQLKLFDFFSQNAHADAVPKQVDKESDIETTETKASTEEKKEEAPPTWLDEKPAEGTEPVVSAEGTEPAEGAEHVEATESIKAVESTEDTSATAAKTEPTTETKDTAGETNIPSKAEEKESQVSQEPQESQGVEIEPFDECQELEAVLDDLCTEVLIEVAVVL